MEIQDLGEIVVIGLGVNGPQSHNCSKVCWCTIFLYIPGVLKLKSKDSQGTTRMKVLEKN